MRSILGARGQFRESLWWVFLGGCLLGFVIVSFNKAIFTENIDFLGTDMLYGMKYMEVDNSSLLAYILKKRIGTIGWVMLLATTYLGIVVTYAYAGWLGVSSGMLVSVAFANYGVKGIILLFVSVFPHYICYIPAWIMLLKGAREVCSFIYFPGRCKRTYISGRKDEIRFVVSLLAKVIGVVIIGILLESYVNPKLLLGFLKIF